MFWDFCAFIYIYIFFVLLYLILIFSTILSDCIGSEFNARGTMRCPNCRVVEVGEWRFSNGQCTQNNNESQAQFLVEAVKSCVCLSLI